MKQTISPYIKNYLAGSIKTQGAKSYGEWLREERKKKNDEKERQALYKEAALQAAGYGSGGEELAKAGLIGDGYASYLQKATAGALKGALSSLDEKRQKEAFDGASGYAEYLSALRQNRLQEVEKAANEALNTPTYKKSNIAPALSALGLTDKQIDTVLAEYRRGIETTEDPSFVYSIARHLTKYGYSYERAYVFCRTAGLSEKKSKELATLMSEEAEKKSAYMEELLAQEKEEKDKPLLSVINPNLR